MKRRYLLLFVFLIVNLSFSETFEHTLFDSLLQKYVVNGLVDYKGLKSDRQILELYLEQLEKVNPQAFDSWPKKHQKAFWVNAYNAITIEGILRNYPIQSGGFFSRIRFPQNSIRQIKRFWKTNFTSVMEKDITLDDIEHEILRKEFDDPRIHFVLVCAAIGCPLLESRAFFPEELDARLDTAAHDFINNLDKVQLDYEKNVLYLSSILKWYKEDIKPTDSTQRNFKKYHEKDLGVITFLLRYMSDADRAFILQNQPQIKYLSYDWTLNEQP